MFAVMGVTGNVGGQIARVLRSANRPVRALLRDEKKAQPWRSLGCDIAVADISDAGALTAAFLGADGVFIVVPPNFDPAPGFPEARAIGGVLREALGNANPRNVIYLSTVGAQAIEPNLLTQHALIEEVLGEAAVPITFLRPAWFLENFAWDVEPARQTGIIRSFLQPLDREIPMVATADIARVAADLLVNPGARRTIVEIEGPHRVSPNEIAAAFSRVLARGVEAEGVPRERWETLFRSQGMKNPLPRMQMLDGFNAGWIRFEQSDAEVLKGSTEPEEVLRALTASR